MKKYFLNDGTSQQGPFTLEELKGKNIKADTPIWYDGLPEWTTAGKLDELKDIIVHAPPPFPAPVADEIKPVAPVTATTAVASTTITQKPAPATVSPAPAKSSKKKTAWLSWVLYVLVLGGVGYFIYQDMEKNKENTGTTSRLDSGSSDTGDIDDAEGSSDDQSNTSPSTEKHEMVVTNDEAAKVEPVPTDAPASDVKADQPPAANTVKANDPVKANEKAKPTVVAPTKAQQDAQKLAAQKLAAKKAEDDKKKQQAALAAAALKEKEYRNNWPKYITIGKMDIKNNDDGVDAFNIPVYNGTNATLDKVTLRVDYMKKEKKVIKSETVIVYGVPPGGGLNGKGPESKKGNNIKVYITGVTSRKLHFCFPVNNGNNDDPYFCN